MIGFIPVNYNKNLSTNNYNDEAYKIYINASNYYGQFPIQWNPNAIAQNPGDKFEIDIDINGYATLKVNGVVKISFQGVKDDYYFTFTSYDYKYISNLKIISSAVDGVA